MYPNYNNPYVPQSQPRYQQMSFDQPVQQVQQPVTPQYAPQTQKQAIIQGEMVESIEIARNTKIPLDGSINYFPLADGSAIVSKQFGMDGIAKTVIYKPIEEKDTTPKYLTANELIDILNDFDFKDLKEEIVRDVKRDMKRNRDDN